MGGRLTVFVDTAALLAILDRDDDVHAEAGQTLRALSTDLGTDLVTHNYVVLETTALVQGRLGSVSVRALHMDVLPAIDVAWVTPELHDAALATLLSSNRRGLSLVDLVSFAFMREHGIDAAFTFDTDFRAAGFTITP